MFLVAYFGVAFGTVPVWVWVSTRIGKQRALVASGAIGAAWMVTFFYLAAPGREWFVLIMWGVLGLQFAAWTLLYPALLADVIDYDELCTGKRREAQYASTWTAVRKFVAIPAASVPLVLLGAAGYVPNQPQTLEVVLWIRILIAGFPGFLMAAGAAVILFYPISASVHRQIREGLALHERGQTAVDPLTHATLPPPVAGVAEDDAWTLDNFSTGELRRLVRAGPTRIVVDASLCTAGAILALVASAGLAYWNLPQAHAQPGLASVASITAAGLALAATAFHVLRVRAAQRLRASPLSASIVRAHLEKQNTPRGSRPEVGRGAHA